jgi:hypothetical protein
VCWLTCVDVSEGLLEDDRLVVPLTLAETLELELAVCGRKTQSS